MSARARAAANSDPAGFIEGADLPLVIDEFQKAPPLLDAIKQRVDRARRGGQRPAGMFLLTGSANVWATLRISESLTGRVERDARDIVERPQQLDELPRLLELAAARVCGLVEPTTMGAAIGMKKDSVRRYLRLLELLYLVRRAPAWSRNIGQRLIKSPKLWLPDSGLACELIGYSEERFLSDDTALAGALFENFVASELLKQASWSEHAVRLRHFRTAGGREVDIVLEAPDGRVVGIEVKLGSTPAKGDFSGLAHLRDKIGTQFIAGVVISTTPETLRFGDRLWALPVSGLWSD